MKTVVANATKLYSKSRPLASSQSYVRAKEIYEASLQIHPILRTPLATFFVSVPPKATSFFLFPTNVEKHVTANEIKVQEFLQNIRNFKPNEVKKSLFKKYVFVSSPRLWLIDHLFIFLMQDGV